MSFDVVTEYLSACSRHRVKKPNPALLQLFADTPLDELDSISLAGNYIGNRGILALMDVIEKLPQFRFLDVSNQKLYNADLSEDSVKGNAAVDRIVEVFRVHPATNALDISHNPISNYAGRKLLALAQMNPRICRIEIHNTRVDFELRRRIAAQLEKNTTALWEADEAREEEGGGGFGATKWEPKKSAADLTVLGGGQRRQTVRSEGVDPDAAKRFVPPVYPKSPEETSIIMQLLSHNVLFSFLGERELATVAGAMLHQNFEKGDVIMAEGSTNNRLYVVVNGAADIIREGQRVFVKGPGTAIGEIELMYDTPCVATVVVSSPTLTSWFLSRETYRFLVMGTAIRRREQFAEYIEAIPFLSSLDRYERTQVADALSLNDFHAGDYIITYDTVGEWMHIVLEGVVEVIGRTPEGAPRSVCRFGKGEYFGELEFLNSHRTVADVVAQSDYVQTAKINKRHFEMCFGSLKELLRRNTMHPKYEYYQNVLSQNLLTASMRDEL